MKITYDESADALYLYLYENESLPGSVACTERFESDVMIDYLADGRIAGIEILNATEMFPSSFRGVGA